MPAREPVTSNCIARWRLPRLDKQFLPFCSTAILVLHVVILLCKGVRPSSVNCEVLG